MHTVGLGIMQETWKTWKIWDTHTGRPGIWQETL